jgi:hypothetical protein
MEVSAAAVTSPKATTPLVREGVVVIYLVDLIAAYRWEVVWKVAEKTLTAKTNERNGGLVGPLGIRRDPSLEPDRCVNKSFGTIRSTILSLAVEREG